MDDERYIKQSREDQFEVTEASSERQEAEDSSHSVTGIQPESRADELRENEARYRALLDSLDEGFCIADVVYDNSGQPVDIFFLEANAAMTRLLGQDVTGQRLMAIDPNFEPSWCEMAARVAQTGEGLRAEGYAEPLGGWYDFYMFKPAQVAPQRIAAIFQDVTWRKRRELNSVFLAEIDEDLVRLSSPAEIMDVAGEKMSEYFDVTRLTIATVDEEAGTLTGVHDNRAAQPVSALGPQRLSDYANTEYLAELKEGHLIVNNDVASDPRTAEHIEIYRQWGMQAQLIAPFVRDGKLEYVIALQRPEPYEWHSDEIDLLKQLALRLFLRLERAWAEEALRKSEELLEARVRERTRQVRRLASELTLAEQAERDRIARILHDDLQQRLYAVQLQIHLLGQAYSEQDDLTFYSQLDETAKELENVIQTTRRLNVDLSPAILHDEGLTEAIGWLARQMKEQYQLDVTVEAQESFAIRDEALRVLLFQTVRELLFNVVKHARVDKAGVTLERVGESQVRIIVHDSGLGFNPDTVVTDAHQSSGLATIRYHLELVGGELELDSVPGGGVRVAIIAPLQVQAP